MLLHSVPSCPRLSAPPSKRGAMGIVYGIATCPGGPDTMYRGAGRSNGRCACNNAGTACCTAASSMIGNTAFTVCKCQTALSTQLKRTSGRSRALAYVSRGLALTRGLLANRCKMGPQACTECGRVLAYLRRCFLTNPAASHAVA